MLSETDALALAERVHHELVTNDLRDVAGSPDWLAWIVQVALSEGRWHSSDSRPFCGPPQRIGSPAVPVRPGCHRPLLYRLRYGQFDWAPIRSQPEGTGFSACLRVLPPPDGLELIRLDCFSRRWRRGGQLTSTYFFYVPLQGISPT